MKKFNFSLATLHRYRGTMEELSMKEFSVELKRFNERERSVFRLRAERKRVTEEMERIRESGERRRELALYETYMTDLREVIREKEALLEESRRALEIRRGALLEVMKDRKVLDVMKERLLGEHRAGSLKNEQKSLDDMAGARSFFGGRKDEK